MPCWGLFGQAPIPLLLANSIEEGLVPPTLHRNSTVTLSLSVASFQMALPASDRVPGSCSLAGQSKQQAQFSVILFTDKHGFQTLELRTTKALLSLMIIQQTYFCSSCWSAGHLSPLPLLFCTSERHRIWAWVGYWQALENTWHWQYLALDLPLLISFESSLNSSRVSQSCLQGLRPHHVFLIHELPACAEPACCQRRLSWLPALSFDLSPSLSSIWELKIFTLCWPDKTQ